MLTVENTKQGGSPSLLPVQVRVESYKELLNKKTPERADLENSQPVHTAHTEKACSGRSTAVWLAVVLAADQFGSHRSPSWEH